MADGVICRWCGGEIEFRRRRPGGAERLWRDSSGSDLCTDRSPFAGGDDISLMVHEPDIPDLTDQAAVTEWLA